VEVSTVAEVVVVVVLVVVPSSVELGMLTVWPMYTRLSDEMPLNPASVSVLIPFAAAMPESVSPETTVCG
jgi:hypothetical protein